MSNKQNNIINDMEMEDMFGKGGAEEVRDYYDDQADIEARTCKIFECDKEATEGWPCCSTYHGYLFANWKIVAENWETIFKAIHDRHDRGHINEIPIGDIPCEEYIYYQQLLNV